MVTKLKDSRKFACLLIILVLLGSSCIMVSAYPLFQNASGSETDEEVYQELLYHIAGYLRQGNVFLYTEATNEAEWHYVMQNYGGEEFFLLLKYMDYEMFDFDGKAMIGEKGEDILKKLVRQETDYAFRVSFIYDENGAFGVKADGSRLNEQTRYGLENMIYQEETDLLYLSGYPEEVKVIYAFTEESLDKFAGEYRTDSWVPVQTLSNNKVYLAYEWTLILFVILAALLIPCNKRWGIGDEKVFRVPLECVWLIWGTILSGEMVWTSVVYHTINNTLADMAVQMGVPGSLGWETEKLLNLGMWSFLFAVVYWGVTCMRAMFTMRKAYWKERTLCGRILRWMKGRKENLGEHVRQGAGEAGGLLRRTWDALHALAKRVYDWMIHLDFRDRSNRTILRIVLINFIVLFVITFFWYHRFTVLIIYSVVLFLFLRKFFRDTQKNYKLLLASTNLLAQGNLDVPIEGDMGIFNPLKTEIQKIQRGFKRAVEEEVKSERMKTELITNVSHDLKTPLTAIITYVDLLKLEKDPQKQKEYLGVLERKSLRLKVLIEDLFEISKAASRNVTMNYMKADVVELLKQVGLENDRKIQETYLDFRWKFPEARVVMFLDVQKTYRIFENLIVNITKYAMPHTRVYVELADEGGSVVISMKNVSASELDFNTEEITDRFVRGDSSRNTEGSGLGLAIAKSFAELQGGTLTISTEADLFKVSIRLPKREEETENGYEVMRM